MRKTLLSLLVTGSFSCLALSCQGTTLGNSCTTDSECEYGQTCFLTGFPGGMCTKGCTRPGAGTECPGKSICASTSTNTGTLICTNACTDDSQCRGGQYTCGPVTPGSTEKACRP